MNKRYLEDQNTSFFSQELLETASVKKAGFMFSLLLSSPQSFMYLLTCLNLALNLTITHAKSPAVTVLRLVSHHPFVLVQEKEMKKYFRNLLQHYRKVLGNKNFTDTDLI